MFTCRAAVPVLALISFLGGAGCGPKASRSTLTLGGVLSLSGPSAAQDNLLAVNLAINEINRNGGVLGKNLAIENLDDQSAPASAVVNANALVAKGYPIILGGEDSNTTQAIETQVADVKSVVYITAAATASILSDSTHNTQGQFFRTVPSDSLQGKLVGERAKSKGLANVVVLYDNGLYGDGLSAQFVQTFQALGGVASRVSFMGGQTDYTAELNSAYASHPDGLFLVGQPQDAVRILKGFLKAPPPQAVTWMFGDALADPNFYSAVGASNFSFPYFGTIPASPSGARETAFQQAFQHEYGKAPAVNFFDEYWYDATYAAALALEAAGDAQPADIKAKLPQIISGPGAAYGATDFNAAVADLHAGKGIQFEGVTGMKGMASNGDLLSGAYNIWKFDPVSGQPTTIESGVTP